MIKVASKISRPIGFAILASGALHGAVVTAQTATAIMAVTAAVGDTCTVTATPLAFGTVNTSAVTDEVAPAVISVVCTAAKTGASVALDGGANEDTGQRRVAGAASTFMPYNVFSDAAHTSAVAVDGDIFTGDLTAVTPNQINVYGQVPVGTYSLGAYTDAVTVTLTY